MRRLLTLLVLLTSAVAVIPASAQSGNILYDNGMEPCNGGCTDAWTISGGYVTSDTINLTSNGRMTGFDIWTWEFPTDKILRIQWSITSSENGGTVYGSGTTLVGRDHIIGLNEYGYDIDKVTVTGLDVNLAAGTYWINLTNAVTAQHNPAYWDENSGNNWHSPGCPSLASFSGVGTIPSETFDIRGVYSNGGDEQSKAPKPGTLVLLTSGLLGLAVVVRRRVL